METVPAVVYVLLDPRYQEGDEKFIRYVGMTTRNPRERLDNHLYYARRGKSLRVARWIAELLRSDQMPILSVVASMPLDEARRLECKLIAEYRAAGVDLTNLTDGGEGAFGCRPSPESVAKRAAVLRGRKLSPEMCAKLSAAQRARPKVPAHWVAMHAANIARDFKATPRGVEHLERLRLANTGRKRSPEFRAKISAIAKQRTGPRGWHHTPESKEKIRRVKAERRKLRIAFAEAT
jgi:hypothetical protein